MLCYLLLLLHTLLFRRSGQIDKSRAVEIITKMLGPELTLRCGDYQVTGIAAIPNHELIAVSTPLRVFDKHVADVNSMVFLSDDVLASVDDAGILLTWRARTGVVQDRLKVSQGNCLAVTKASATGILVGTTDGEIIRVEHGNGKNLAVDGRYTGGAMDGFSTLARATIYLFPWATTK